MEWTLILLIIVVILAAVGIGYWLIPILKKNGILKEEGIKGTQQILSLIALVLQNIKIEDGDVKSDINTIFGICQKVVQYVEQTMKDELPEDKKLHAMQVIEGVLGTLGIELSDDIKKLIEIGIESAVNLLPRTNKG